MLLSSYRGHLDTKGILMTGASTKNFLWWKIVVVSVTLALLTPRRVQSDDAMLIQAQPTRVSKRIYSRAVLRELTLAMSQQSRPQTIAVLCLCLPSGNDEVA